ncbi:aspartate kinase [Pedobacter sp. BAL39]|uniref:aspartate kinase n=1 Tax=Pedobacter sp. BAL39 TaxID=391596 RepID=UPI000155AD6D|nr:aspartate kinase [Pedobacter sp. BAL39]EDM34468.1 aspartate kinase [Pedobacter sp. BAL39]
MIVFKFGGASVKDATGVMNVANIVRNHQQEKLLIVISAMGKITNQLEDLYRAYISGMDHTQEIFDGIKAFHFNMMATLFPDHKNPVFDDVNNSFVEVEWLLEEEPSDAPDYIYDQIVSIGELVSTKIVAAYLNSAGCQAKWVDARNFIHTDNNYREGNVNWEKTEMDIRAQLPQVLEKNIVVTQGFIGGTSENFTTTLGREGSDYSAAIFCSCLHADYLTIWKDVPGVLNADPKWFDETERIPQLSYRDAIELAYYGATIIHPKTIKPLQNKNIPLYVRSFIDSTAEGTDITTAENHLPVPSFIFKVNQVLISILPKDFSFIIEENLSDIFNIFHEHKVKINTMLNSAISFSVSIDDNAEKLQALIAALSVRYQVKYNTGLELVTIRYYNQQTIDRVTINKNILLEVKSRNTCQIVMRDKEHTS